MQREAPILPVDQELFVAGVEDAVVAEACRQKLCLVGMALQVLSQALG